VTAAARPILNEPRSNHADFSTISITSVWTAIGGQQPRHGRAPALWRDTADRNVSLNEATGTWFDFVDSVGGGIIALVSLALRCDKPAAVSWLESSGFIAPRDPAARVAESEARRDIARGIREAKLWRTAALDLCDEAMDRLKSALPLKPPQNGEIKVLTDFERSLKRASDATLVTLYRQWRETCPGTTDAMIASARRIEIADGIALGRFLEAM